MEFHLEGPAGRLEALLERPDATEARAAAIACHPHPAHGGTMHNTVVFRVARGLRRAGVAVLRFNFRGVGASEGTHDGGPGELDDARAALDALARAHPGTPLWAAGFSFGARTAARLALEDARVERLLGVALPVDAIDCAGVERVERPALYLFGGADGFGTLASMRARFPALPPGVELDEIDRADHLFRGRSKALEERVRAWAERSLAAGASR